MSLFFTPQSGAPGTPVILIFDEAGFFVTSVTFNGINAPFSTAGDGVINTQVPPAATTGLIRVSFIGGSVTSSFAFNVVQPPVLNIPVITSISPVTGPPGTNVVLMGSNLENITSASLNNVQCLVRSVLASRVEVTVPGSSISGRIVLTGSTGSATAPVDFIYTQSAQAPVVNSFSPATGPVGTIVTITGLRFGNAQQVFFNGVPASFSTLSDTQISAMAPSNAGNGKISVANAFGAGSSLAAFTYPALIGVPVISSFSPASGKALDLITVTGQNLSSVTSFFFNGVPASFTAVSNIQLTARVPFNATSGKLKAVNPSGQSLSTANFTITDAPGLPAITGFNPPAASSGTSIQISGTFFSGATSVVFKPGKPATFSESNGTLIQCVVPEGAETGPVTITTPVGTATSSIFFFVGNAVIAPPVVTGFSPASGGFNLQVNITGSQFLNAASVLFGNTPATFNVISDTLIQARVPSGAMTGSIKVINAGGVGTSPNSFQVIQLQPTPPVIFSFSPQSGAPGITVDLFGNRLDSVFMASIMGLSCPILSVLNEQVRILIPDGVQSGPIVLSGLNGTATTSSPFMANGNVLPPPATGTPGIRTSGANFFISGPAGFENEVPPTEGQFDRSNIAVQLVSGQSFELNLIAEGPDDVTSDLVQLTYLSPDSRIILKGPRRIGINTPFSVTVETLASLPESEVSYDFRITGQSTTNPGCLYNAYRGTLLVIAPVEVVANNNRVLGTCGERVFNLDIVRRRFAGKPTFTLTNLQQGVTFEIKSQTTVPNATIDRGGVRDRYELLLKSIVAAELGDKAVNVKVNLDPAVVRVKPDTFNVNVQIAQASLALMSSGSQFFISRKGSTSVPFRIDSFTASGPVIVKVVLDRTTNQTQPPVISSMVRFENDNPNVLPEKSKRLDIVFSANMALRKDDEFDFTVSLETPCGTLLSSALIKLVGLVGSVTLQPVGVRDLFSIFSNETRTDVEFLVLARDGFMGMVEIRQTQNANGVTITPDPAVIDPTAIENLSTLVVKGDPGLSNAQTIVAFAPFLPNTNVKVGEEVFIGVLTRDPQNFITLPNPVEVLITDPATPFVVRTAAPLALGEPLIVSFIAEDIEKVSVPDVVVQPGAVLAAGVVNLLPGFVNVKPEVNLNATANIRKVTLLAVTVLRFRSQAPSPKPAIKKTTTSSATTKTTTLKTNSTKAVIVNGLIPPAYLEPPE